MGSASPVSDLRRRPGKNVQGRLDGADQLRKWLGHRVQWRPDGAYQLRARVCDNNCASLGLRKQPRLVVNRRRVGADLLSARAAEATEAQGAWRPVDADQLRAEAA
eukprot:jgi/Tetstr1/458798/TSEL_045182.t1